jgi:hypothetical protein
MRFSECFEIERHRRDDWFDPHLTVDTKLFVDPLLLLKHGTAPVWRGAHEELIAHFVHCYDLVAQGGHRDSLSVRKATTLLRFPEPREFNLGYTAAGVRGSGGGPRVARMMIEGIVTAIDAGLTEPRHIEEIGILNERIGADRISDAVCNILKRRFIRYTQTVCRRHGVPLETHRLVNTGVDLSAGRWLTDEVGLPTNPDSGGPIVLVPRSFLNDLPVLNAWDWFDAHVNEDVRTQLNISISSRASKADIVKHARRHPELVRTWADSVSNRTSVSGYDFAGDPRGVVQWDDAPARYAEAHPIGTLSKVETVEDLATLLHETLLHFQRFVEHQRGWSLLWVSDDKEKPEEAAQLLFLGLAQPYLRVFGVELDREVELGRGPVDFKLSSGSSARILIEVKKAHNGKFWNGLDSQLPSYLTSDDTEHGWFLAIRYRSNPASTRRMAELPGRVRKAASASGKSLHYFAIDARRPPSASS